MKEIKKTIYTLNIGNYAPEICSLTFPLIQGYADKIGAAFSVITEQKFPTWPVTYEKLQIHELAKADNNDWSIFVDADTVINPDFFDITAHMSKDVVAHNKKDMAGIRWKYDEYFHRDGRHIGSGNWFAVASDWCRDLWRPLDITLDEALDNIHVTGAEREGGVHPSHLIDDYTLSRNIARYGLKFTTVADICGSLGFRAESGRSVSPFLVHLYNISEEEKLHRILALMGAPVGVMVRDDDLAIGYGLGRISPEKEKELRNLWGVTA